MQKTKFIVQANPVAQARPRVVGRGKKKHAYNPKNTFRQAMPLFIPPKLRGSMHDGPVELRVIFYLERPKSHWKKSGGLTKSAPPFPLGKPDADNLLKPLMDGLTDAGVWKDDGQAVCVFVGKLYAHKPDGGAADIEITQFTVEEMETGTNDNHTKTARKQA